MEVDSLTTIGRSLKDLTAGMASYKDSLSGTAGFLPLVDASGARLGNSDKQGKCSLEPNIILTFLAGHQETISKGSGSCLHAKAEKFHQSSTVVDRV